MKLPNLKNIFVINGGIGAGKSTALTLLAARHDTLCLEEPIEQWTSLKTLEGEINLLDEVYKVVKNKTKSSAVFMLQTLIAATLAERYARAVDPDLEMLAGKKPEDIRFIFLERNVRSGEAFLRMNRAHATAAEYSICKRVINALSAHTDDKHLQIFLTAPQAVLLERITLRARPEERETAARFFTEMNVTLAEQAAKDGATYIDTAGKQPIQVRDEIIRIAESAQ